MATGPIETHLHRSFNWENGAPGPREGQRGRSARCGNGLFAQCVRLRSEINLRRAFEESCLYNLQSKGVLYLLESAIRPGMSSTALLGFNQYTLEHMMPKKWRNKWGALDDEAATRRDRKLLTLGNLAIITHSLNASIRDADWPTKKQGKGYKDGLALCAAGLATMAGALEKESWDEGDIADRAEWLADKALEVWR